MNILKLFNSDYCTVALLLVAICFTPAGDKLKKIIIPATTPAIETKSEPSPSHAKVEYVIQVEKDSPAAKVLDAFQGKK